MRIFFYGLFFLIIVSCGKQDRNSPTGYSSLSFSLDTLVVNPGEDIIDLSSGIWNSTMNKDNSILYNFSQNRHQLEVIDLNSLTLVDKIKFDKEGPNGTGSYLITINMDSNDDLYLTNFQQTGVFNLQGEKIRAYKLRNEKFHGDSLLDTEEISPDFLVSNDGNTLYGLISSITKNGYALGVLDYKNKTLKRHDLKDFEKTQNFNLTYQSEGGLSIRVQSVIIQEFKQKYIISNSIFNTVAMYDPHTDSITYHSYDSKLTENAKKGTYKTTVESIEEFSKEIDRLSQEIHFVAPVWDQQNGVFYRFSYKVLPKDDKSEENPIDKLVVFLTVLDDSFNIIGEALVPQLTKRPGKHFVKDGKIWMYENIEDELGFVTLSIHN